MNTIKTKLDKRYQVWFVPTEQGKKSFGWTEKLLGGHEPMTEEDARLEAYLANREETAPDANEYGSYMVREIDVQ